MRIFNLEPVDMGKDQQEIADEVLEMVSNMEFVSEEEFYELETGLIAEACKKLKWHSVPTTGGFEVEWE